MKEKQKNNGCVRLYGTKCLQGHAVPQKIMEKYKVELFIKITINKIIMKNVNMQNNLQHMYTYINWITYKYQSEKIIKFVLHNITLKLGI